MKKYTAPTMKISSFKANVNAGGFAALFGSTLSAADAGYSLRQLNGYVLGAIEGTTKSTSTTSMNVNNINIK